MARGKSLREQITAERVPAPAGGRLTAQVEKTRVRQKSYMLDLRIHSPASLGYLGIEGIDTAPALVRLAKTKGLDVIAVTDYYSGAFVDRVIDAARESELTVLPGVDLRCQVAGCDDLVISCIFPESCRSGAVDQLLARLDIPKRAAGDRKFIVQRELREILQVVDELGAIALPSRIDKTPSRFSIVPLLVEEYGFRAFDVAYPDTAQFFRKRWPKIKFQLFSFSSANALAQVGSRIAKVKMPIPGFEGIRQLVGRSEA